MIIEDLILALLAIGAALVLILGLVQAIRHTAPSRALGRGRSRSERRVLPREARDHQLGPGEEVPTDPVVEAAAARATPPPEAPHPSDPVAEWTPPKPSRSRVNREASGDSQPAPIADTVSPEPASAEVADDVVSGPASRRVTSEAGMILEPPDLPDFADPVVPEPPPPVVTPRPAPVHEAPRAADPVVPEPPPPVATPRPAPVHEAPRAADPVVSEPAPTRVTSEPAAVPEPAPVLPVEECSALYESGRYQALIALAEPHLYRADEEAVSSPGRPDEVAALWGLVGLSRQALNEEEAARAAFEEAISVAPESEQDTYRRQLAELAAGVASRLVTRVETRVGISEEEGVKTLREATSWLQHGLEVMPDDWQAIEGGGRKSLASSLARAQGALWAAYGQQSNTLVQRGEFERARRLLREALAEEALPPDRREAFEDLITTACTGEIGNLTAHAIRIMEEEGHTGALDALQQAEHLYFEIPEDRLPQASREEIRRRLWWGYTKLGLRRMESGEFEAAVEPLLHALKIGARDAERERQTRLAALQALEGLVAEHAVAVGQLSGTLRREAAETKAEHLRTLIGEALAVGLTGEDLARTLQAVEQIEREAWR